MMITRMWIEKGFHLCKIKNVKRVCSLVLHPIPGSVIKLINKTTVGEEGVLPGKLLQLFNYWHTTLV